MSAQAISSPPVRYCRIKTLYPLALMISPRGQAFMEGADVDESPAWTDKGKGRPGFPSQEEEACFLPEGLFIIKAVEDLLSRADVADKPVQ